MTGNFSVKRLTGDTNVRAPISFCHGNTGVREPSLGVTNIYGIAGRFGTQIPHLKIHPCSKTRAIKSSAQRIFR